MKALGVLGSHTPQLLWSKQGNPSGRWLGHEPHGGPTQSAPQGARQGTAVSQAPRLRPSGASMVSVGPGPGPACSFGI